MGSSNYCLEEVYMLGAIIGDISGSRYEGKNHKSKEFELLTYQCHPTDDSNMTLAIWLSMSDLRPIYWRTIRFNTDSCAPY